MAGARPIFPGQHEQGALFTTPITLSALSGESRTCPVCRESYREPPHGEFRSNGQSSDKEWAVRVDMVAERWGMKQCCGHILGRNCLTNHIQAPGPWRNKCPICRDLWFGLPGIHNDANNEIQLSTVLSPQRLARGNTLPRRSPRTLLQSHSDRVTHTRLRGSLNNESSVPNSSRRRRRPRADTFVQQILNELQVREGDDTVPGTVVQVEQRLRNLYGNTRQI